MGSVTAGPTWLGLPPSPLPAMQRHHPESRMSDASTAILKLLDIMARLRAPDGCPWDREQSFATIAPYTIEEAY